MPSEITTQQKHLLAQLNTLLNHVSKADALLKSGQSQLADTQLLSVIAKTLVMLVAAKHDLEARLDFPHPEHRGPAQSRDEPPKLSKS
jgi:hypothetical protein